MASYRTDRQMQTLAYFVRSRRKDLGLTQLDLADLSGASLRFIHDLESGKATVRLDRLLAVTRALGLELELAVRRPTAVDVDAREEDQ